MFEKGTRVLIKTLSTMAGAVSGVVLEQDGCWFKVRTRHSERFYLCTELVKV